MSIRSIPSIFLALALLISMANAQGTASALTTGRQKSTAKSAEAQNAPANRSAAGIPEPSSSSQVGHSGESGAEPGGQKEGEQEENAQFKQSASVRWIAKVTGLSLDRAYWLAVGINFLILAALVALGLKSSLPKMLRSRTEEIQKSIQEARRASDEARRRLSSIEERLSKMNLSISEMEQQAEAQNRAEEQRILAAAEEEKRKIVQAAEQEIAATAGAAQRELKKLAVELATALAEKQIKVATEQDKQLVQDFAQQLEGEISMDGRR
jgi:F-type H+-transporting ATPase subunit b